MFKLSKRIGIVAAVATAVIGGGVAFAAWTATGTGTASATAGKAAGVTATATVGVTTAKLYPGGSAALVLTFDNPNPYQATVTGLTLRATNGVVVVTQPGTGCDGTNSRVLLDNTATGAIATYMHATPIVVPAKANGTDGTLDVSIPAGVIMGDSNNACQEATFTLNLDVASTS